MPLPFGLSRRALALIVVVVVGLAALRVAIAAAYHSSSPDGDQYFAIAQELVRDHRVAYAPPPAPPAYSRLPGYPLFLALLVDHGLLPRADHVARAAQANVLLDLVSAALLALCLLRMGVGRWAALAGFVGVVLSPVQVLFASYALTESLATLFTVAFTLLVIEGRRRASSWPWLGAGAVLGFGILVRADLIVVLPMLAFAVWVAPALPSGDAPLARRSALRRGAMTVALAAAIVSAWMVRNQALFGAPHPFGSEWMDFRGDPLPTGFMSWMRTWGAGTPGDSDFGVPIFFQRRILSRASITSRMVDDAEQRALLERAIDTYDQKGLTPEVDAMFRELARLRTRHAPLRTFVQLPLARLMTLFQVPREGDYPFRVAFLGLPRHRQALFGTANALVYALALLGAIVAFRAGGAVRWLALVLVIGIASRCLLHAWAVPTFLSQRYIAEVIPFMIALAVLGADTLARRRRHLVASPPPRSP